MARRPLPLNTWGEIHVRKVRKGVHEAHGRFRHDDGVTRQHRRTGGGQDAARDNLLTYFRELTGEATGEIDRDMRFTVTAEAWFTEFKQQQQADGKSPNTARTYRQQLDRWVLPNLGELTNREVRAGTIDRLLQRVAREGSVGTAQLVRTVVSNICAWGVRNDVWDANPAKGGDRLLSSKPKPAARALTQAERADVIGKLEAAGEKRRNHKGRGTPSLVWQQLPDYQRALWSTGARPSEVLALSAQEVSPDGRRVRLAWHLVADDGGGVLRMAGRKGGGRELDLIVPEWSAPLWLALSEAADDGPLFPTRAGLYQRPDSVSPILSKAVKEIGYGWVTAKTWRKTVAAVLRDAGLSSVEGSDQLGNSPRVYEAHYVPPRAGNTPSAAVALNEAQQANRDVSVRKGDQHAS